MNLYVLYVASGLRSKMILASGNMTTKLIWSRADYCMRIKEQSISKPLSRHIKAIFYSRHRLFFRSGILQTVSQRLTGSNLHWYQILDEEKVDWIQRGLKKHLANGQIWWCSMFSSPGGWGWVGGQFFGFITESAIWSAIVRNLIHLIDGAFGGVDRRYHFLNI